MYTYLSLTMVEWYNVHIPLTDNGRVALLTRKLVIFSIIFAQNPTKLCLRYCQIAVDNLTLYMLHWYPYCIQDKALVFVHRRSIKIHNQIFFQGISLIFHVSVQHCLWIHIGLFIVTWFISDYPTKILDFYSWGLFSHRSIYNTSVQF